ncbi:MAG: hypothetical protein LBB45_00200 [Methanobrevibacter sp.]|jgi:hypothetical protein|nr:hypothetical protein [Candidatus Methanovirga basalitermitum]
MRSTISYNKNPLRKEKPIIDFYSVNTTTIYSYMTIFLVLMILLGSVLFVVSNHPPNII